MAAKTHAELVDATRREVQRYSVDGLITSGMFIADEQRSIYAAVALFNKPLHQRPPVHADFIVLARVEGDQIIIEEDRTDRPLYEALSQNAGVPEAQIVCAYVAEAVEPDFIESDA